MTVLNNMQTSGFPPEVIQAGMKNVVSLQFATLDSEELSGLMDSISNMSAEVPA